MCSGPGPSSSGSPADVRSCGQAGSSQALALCHTLSKGEAKQAPQLGVRGTPMPGGSLLAHAGHLGNGPWTCEEQSPRSHGGD